MMKSMLSVFAFSLVLFVHVFASARGRMPLPLQKDVLPERGIHRVSRGDCGVGVTYTFSEGILTISGAGEMDNFSETSTPWFTDRFKIKTVEIGEGVESVGDYAFDNCQMITSVSFPSTLKYIGRSAFEACLGLTKITIPSNVNSIGRSAFYFCSGLKSVNIPGRVKSIEPYTFSYCEELSQVDIADGVISINDFAFSECSQMQTIFIPNSVVSIGNQAFSECRGLTSLVIPDSVTSLGDDAFFGCSKIVNLTLSNKLGSIRKNTFSYCMMLKKVSIPESVTSIEEGAFSHCSRMTNVVIPGSVISIGTSAFSYCNELKSVNVPESVIVFGEKAFDHCPNLTSVSIHANIPKWAFSSCYSLTDVIISESVSSIEEGAFEMCSGLTSVFIPASVSYIGVDAFRGCDSLETVYYCGSHFISNDSLSSCSALNSVCVSPEYTFSSFGGVTVTSTQDATKCRSFQMMFNPCFTPAYVDGDVVAVKRKSVTEWENHTNECFAYQCDNGSGLVKWSSCNTTEGMIRTCIDGLCFENKTPYENVWVIEISIDDVKSVDVNTTDIIFSLTSLTGIKENELIIGTETGKDGFMIHIVVYTKDEAKANQIKKMIEDIDKGTTCNYGVLCRTKSVRVFVKLNSEVSLSDCHQTKMTSYFLHFMFILLVIVFI